MISARIDLASVDVLQSVLGRLKNVDSVGVGLTDDIWGCVVYEQSSYLENDVQFLEARHTLYQLRESHRTLSVLLSSLERTLTSLRGATYPALLAHGIKHLPDELLAHVFTLSASCSWQSAQSLSSVSRRFRSIALATPRLWATLPSPRVDEAGRASMTRWLTLSKNVGLAVELPLLITEDNEPNPDWDDALGMLMAHKHRWQHLTMDFAAIKYGVDDELEAETLPNLEFPEATLDAVESLCVGDSPHRYEWAEYGTDYDYYDDASSEFYASWKFPRLKSLTSEMHIPPPGVFPALTDFSLDLSIHDEPEPFLDDPNPQPLLDALVDFLNSVPALQCLKFVAGEYSYTPPQLVATLPSLTTFRMENRYEHPESLRLMRNVAHALRMPAVEDIALCVYTTYTSELTGDEGAQWLSDLLPDCQGFERLKRLALEYTVANDVGSAVLKHKHISQFPALEELEVCTSSAPSINEIRANGIRKKAPVGRIRFCDLHQGHETAVREYVFGDESLNVRSFFE